MSRARNTADGIARAITDGIVLNADINASASIDQSKFANLSVNPQSGDGASAYTFVLADEKLLTTATSASAKTFTIPPQSSVTWVSNSVIRVVNYGAGTLTIAGGAGVTVTNVATTIAQYQSASVIRTAENAWTLVPFAGGVSNADFSNAATGTVSEGGFTFKYVIFSNTGTLTVTQAGLAKVLCIGGGGSGGTGQEAIGADYAGAGGGGGGVFERDVFLQVGAYTATIGSGGPSRGGDSQSGGAGTQSSLARLFTGGSDSLIVSPGNGNSGLTGGSSGMGFVGAAGGGYGAGGGGGAGGNAPPKPGGNTKGNGGVGLLTVYTQLGAAGRVGGGGQGAGAAGAVLSVDGGGSTDSRNGLANSGGGGAGRYANGGVSGAGGSGVVVVRVRL